MANVLQAIYQRIPLIRELLNIHGEMKQLKWISSIRMKSELDRHTAQLLQDPRYAGSKNLTRHAYQVYSQGGEDGILTEIFARIGTTSKTFLEIGIGNGLENNTVALLAHRGWRGEWIDGDAANVSRIREHFAAPIAEQRLRVTQSFVTMENVATLLKQLQVPEEIDLFSLDIDRNTYWLWSALAHFRPRVAIMEYNATPPADVDWKVSYVGDRGWDGTSYFGASLKAFELLGRKLGYSLVGCTLNGVNAFFVRDDLIGDKFEAPFTSEHHYEPPRYYLSYRGGHPSGFTDDSRAPPAPWTP